MVVVRVVVVVVLALVVSPTDLGGSWGSRRRLWGLLKASSRFVVVVKCESASM